MAPSAVSVDGAGELIWKRLVRILEKVEDELRRVNEKLSAIESLLQRLPEIQAAVFMQMAEDYKAAQLRGNTAHDIWDVPSPENR